MIDFFIAWKRVAIEGLLNQRNLGVSTVVRLCVMLDRRLTARRIRAYATMALASQFLAYILALLLKGDPPYDGFGHPIAPDFVNRYAAGRFVVDNDIQWIYSVPRQIATQQAFLGAGHPLAFAPFISPAAVAYLYAPFAMTPYLVGVGLWTIASVALLLVSIRLLWPLVPGLHRFGLGMVLLIVLSCWPVVELVLDGQDSALSLFLLVLSLRLLLARRDFSAGAILGLGAFKPQVFLLMPILLLCQKRWFALGGWSATTLTIVLTSVILVGWDGIQSYVALLTSDELRNGISDLNWKMGSLTALARSVLNGPLAFLDAPATVAIAIAALSLFVYRARWPSQDQRHFQLLYAIAVTGSVLASPYLFIYDCTVLLIPILILVNKVTWKPSVRLFLASGYLLMLTSPLRHAAFGNAPWPVSVLSGPWVALPITIVALGIYHRLAPTRANDNTAEHLEMLPT